jgi:hypothetical protein
VQDAVAIIKMTENKVFLFMCDNNLALLEKHAQLNNPHEAAAEGNLFSTSVESKFSNMSSLYINAFLGYWLEAI